MKTKEKALEVLMTRQDQDRRLHDQLEYFELEKNQIETLHIRNLVTENQLRTSTAMSSIELKQKKKAEAKEIKYEKREISKLIILFVFILSYCYN